MTDISQGTSVFRRYFILTYIAVLINTFGYLKSAGYTDKMTLFFSVSVFLVYSLIYMLPMLILIFLPRIFINTHILTRRVWLIYGPMVLCAWLTQVFIYADKTIYNLFSFHINGFVWNILFTPGGVESLGGGASTSVTYMLILAGFLILQVFFMVVLLKEGHIRTFLYKLRFHRIITALTVVLVIAAVFQGIAYGLADFYGKRSMLVASESFPLYIPIRFKHLAQKIGLKSPPQTEFRMKVSDSLDLNYPLATIEKNDSAEKFNIVWLVAESLRADMLDPEIMPSTWQYSRQASCFENHYSSGNGTRMGIFGMFYGLYGNSWFTFLNENRGPVLMDLLIDGGYQLSMYSSAKFSYPEFDRTVFARLPIDKLHDGLAGAGWQRDRENVTNLLDFIENRDKTKPFMTFMFFESPHAKYYFPPENEIRKPFLEDFNYATADISKDIQLIKNRYINSCNHLDSQFQRVLEYLRESDLLDSTIVVITGDHGEEFMEKGHWGHNSGFTQQQVHVPLVIGTPGKQPARISRITSHLDIPATLMTLLGVTTPPVKYSLGIDLYGTESREYAVFSDWSHICIEDLDSKAVFSLKGFDVFDQLITTENDEAIADRDLFYSNHKIQFLDVMKDMGKFN